MTESDSSPVAAEQTTPRHHPVRNAFAWSVKNSKAIIEVVLSIVGVLLVIQANRYLSAQTDFMKQQTSMQAKPQIRVASEQVESNRGIAYGREQLHVVLRGGFMETYHVDDVVLLEIAGTGHDGSAHAAWRILDDYYRVDSSSNLGDSPEWTATDGGVGQGNAQRLFALNLGYANVAKTLGPYGFLMLHTFVRVTYTDGTNPPHTEYFTSYGDRIPDSLGAAVFSYRDAAYTHGREVSLDKLTAKSLTGLFAADEQRKLTTTKPGYPF